MQSHAYSYNIITYLCDKYNIFYVNMFSVSTFPGSQLTRHYFHMIMDHSNYIWSRASD